MLHPLMGTDPFRSQRVPHPLQPLQFIVVFARIDVEEERSNSEVVVDARNALM
jgi:hypothetical protein